MAEEKKRYTEEELEQIDSNITDALLEAANYSLTEDGKKIQREIVITRKEKVLFTFRIEPIDEDTFRKCRRQNTRNKGKRSEEIDESRWAAQIIYEATIDTDKERLWKNREAWQRLNVASGVDVVNIVLTPGEKSAILEELLRIGSYNDDLEDLIKNV